MLQHGAVASHQRRGVRLGVARTVTGLTQQMKLVPRLPNPEFRDGTAITAADVERAVQSVVASGLYALLALQR